VPEFSTYYEEITLIQSGALASLMPPRPYQLLMVLVGMGAGGLERAYATALTLAVKMNCSESTYHRARRYLEREGWISIERRRVGPRRHRSSLFAIGGENIKGVVTRSWSIFRERMGVIKDRQKRRIYNSIVSKNSFKVVSKSPIYRELMQNGLLNKGCTT
jgi:hypothetical protein